MSAGGFIGVKCRKSHAAGLEVTIVDGQSVIATLDYDMRATFTGYGKQGCYAYALTIRRSVTPPTEAERHCKSEDLRRYAYLAIGVSRDENSKRSGSEIERARSHNRRRHMLTSDGRYFCVGDAVESPIILPEPPDMFRWQARPTGREGSLPTISAVLTVHTRERRARPL